MSKVTLLSVFTKLINEDQDAAQKLLRQWYLEASAELNRSLDEEVHIHVHKGGSPVVTAEDGMDPAAGDDDEDDTMENLSPINGSQDMDTDGDSEVSDNDSDDDVDGEIPEVGDTEDDNVGLEDKVDDLQSEFDALKAELVSQLGLDLDDEDNSDNSDNDDGEEVVAIGQSDNDDDDDSETNEDFDDLEESFELERVSEPSMSGDTLVGASKDKVKVNNKSLALDKDVNNRIGGKPVEIMHDDDYDGETLQPSPKVADAPLRKNQVKNAADNLEKVDSKGPKDAMLNKAQPANKTDGSLLGSGKI